MRLVSELFVKGLRFEVVVTSRDVETHKAMTDRESRLKAAIRDAITKAVTEVAD